MKMIVLAMPDSGQKLRFGKTIILAFVLNDMIPDAALLMKQGPSLCFSFQDPGPV